MVKKLIASAWTFACCLGLAKCASLPAEGNAIALMAVLWFALWAIVCAAIVQIGKLFDPNTKA